MCSYIWFNKYYKRTSKQNKYTIVLISSSFIQCFSRMYFLPFLGSSLFSTSSSYLFFSKLVSSITPNYTNSSKIYNVKLNTLNVNKFHNNPTPTIELLKKFNMSIIFMKISIPLVFIMKFRNKQQNRLFTHKKTSIISKL